MSTLAAQGDGAKFGPRDDNSRGWNDKSDGHGKDGKYMPSGAECKTCGKRGHTIDTCFKIHACHICGKHGHLANICYQNPKYKTQQNSQQSHSRPSNLGPSPECQICSKKGHTTTNCFFRTYMSSGHPAAAIPTCRICGLKGHVALNCTHRTNFAYQGSEPPASLAALTVQNTGNYNSNLQQTSSNFPGGFHLSNGASSSNYSQQSIATTNGNNEPTEIWIGDSGATHHMTSDLRNLTLAQPFASDAKITIGQNHQNGSVSRKEQ